VLGEQAFDPRPFELQTDEAARRAAAGQLRLQRPLAVERRRLLQIDQAAEAELER